MVTWSSGVGDRENKDPGMLVDVFGRFCAGGACDGRVYCSGGPKKFLRVSAD